MNQQEIDSKTILIPHQEIMLTGNLAIPINSTQLVLFVHGSGSSHLSPRNQYVAEILNKNNIATLLFDLLTPEEEAADLTIGQFRFNLEFLAARLLIAMHWVLKQPRLSAMNIGYFGASTGGGAALIAAAKEPNLVKAVVSRGGRPDLADEFLHLVKAPTLLIVGGHDLPVIKMNQTAFNKLLCIKKLEIVAGATHLFEEPGKLEQVAHLATSWFLHNL